VTVGADEPVPTKVSLDVPRALTARERALIDVLLEGPLGRAELREQAGVTQVIGLCSCGCPSGYLDVDPSTRRASFEAEEVPFGQTEAVPISAYHMKSRGFTEVTLHVVQGYMFELEIWAGEYGRRPRPDPSRLEYWDWRRDE
jgi:hypothetical protein